LYGEKAPKIIEYVNNTTRQYVPVFLFRLTDRSKRLFSVNRLCSQNGFGEWLPIAGDAPLADLAKKYLKHIGQESFYELA
jgi:hypothetical protein